MSRDPLKHVSWEPTGRRQNDDKILDSPVFGKVKRMKLDERPQFAKVYPIFLALWSRLWILPFMEITGLSEHI